MKMQQAPFAPELVYSPGLDATEEAVISSHFMHRLCRDVSLTTYDDERFAARAIEIDQAKLDGVMIPALLAASRAFAADRAKAAKRRARDNHALYGLAGPDAVGTAQFITELMFDRQFQRGGRTGCARMALCARMADCLAAGRPIAMLIPALPFKISSPLKTRGASPDLAEVNFLLGLYEIVLAVEMLYEAARPARGGSRATFTVVSDGSRFEALVREPPGRVAAYRAALVDWVGRFDLGDYVEIVDYRELLRARLPADMLARKQAIRARGHQDYVSAMMPVFDPADMPRSLATAALIEPDPEALNPEGRFASLLKSLVYTIDYAALERFAAYPAECRRLLYRELTGHLYEPYSPVASDAVGEPADALPRAAPAWEALRRAMLREAWDATIAYMAEIKSDRELEREPLAACLPDHVRWTIHAKPGQLCLLALSALGMPVQAWAGSAAFKRTGNGRIKLCTLPVLALEGAGAIPVLVRSRQAGRQPLFYIYPDVAFTGIEEFLEMLGARLVRRRAA